MYKKARQRHYRKKLICNVCDTEINTSNRDTRQIGFLYSAKKIAF